ncbi:nitrogen regulation protein NR(I) [Pseudomonas ficuserectae]|uniref:nitrogen regulation protein NR(I) n=1 Tax=Pseudomonas ficuserectae TaxID=53410 RepID=UPI0006D62B8C|nr:nitrogen regulation protein NR(I) [Pseudomonas ficuserectae]
MSRSETVWIVDDDRSIRWVLEKALQQEGMTTQSFDSADGVMSRLARQQPDVIISDIRMPGASGLDLLARIREQHPRLPVIIMTAHSDLDSAVASYQGGAFEYLPKPFDVDEAVSLVKRANQHAQEQQGLDVAPTLTRTPEIIGEAPAMQEVFRAIGRLSHSNITVLINGESGTGKELVAHALHRHSPRSASPFIALNMAAIPKDLMESELFGHEKGAFTGAANLRRGRFEQADGGTLFLDEITSLSLAGQSKLLRALQEREIERVGGGHGIKVNVRVVAATNVDLRKEVADGEFREDLFYHLNVYPITLPPLRERRDDIPLLINAFLKRFCQEYGRTPAGLTMRALKTLLRYDFAGNVRELQNLIERGLIASDEGQAIDLVHIFRNESLPEDSYSLNPEGTLRQTSVSETRQASTARLLDTLGQSGHAFSIDDLEQRLIHEALDESEGNLAAASRLLGLSRAQFAYRLKKQQPGGA